MVVELSWKFSLKFELISGGLGNNNNANMGGTGQNTYTSNTFYVDPRATFEAFFGTSNPFENFFNIHNSSSGLFTDHLNADHNNMTDNLDDPFAFSSLGGGLKWPPFVWHTQILLKIAFVQFPLAFILFVSAVSASNSISAKKLTNQ